MKPSCNDLLGLLPNRPIPPSECRITEAAGVVPSGGPSSIQTVSGPDPFFPAVRNK
jgi:hypothetical protein